MSGQNIVNDIEDHDAFLVTDENGEEDVPEAAEIGFYDESFDE